MSAPGHRVRLLRGADDDPCPSLLGALLEQIRTGLEQQAARPFVLGLCGAQGSGKTTLAAVLVEALEARGISAAALSLDDLYLARTQRQELARQVHPLFVTRGVPGTHDLALGLDLLEALGRGEAAALPRFDKGRDEPLERQFWPLAPPELEVLLFEGWCLGARAQGRAALEEPINQLEAEADPDARWRRHVNALLEGPYQTLWDRIDHLVLLAAPGWEVVGRWRDEQEEALRAAGAVRAMDKAALARFIQHYERLTRWILAEMPARADLVVRLGPGREVLGIG